MVQYPRHWRNQRLSDDFAEHMHSVCKGVTEHPALSLQFFILPPSLTLTSHSSHVGHHKLKDQDLAFCIDILQLLLLNSEFSNFNMVFLSMSDQVGFEVADKWS